MNLPSYRSNPPSLLGMLFEETQESKIKTKTENQTGFKHLSPEEDTNEPIEL